MTVLFLLLLAAASGRGERGVLVVKPADSLAQVSQRLARDPAIREVVLEAGTYAGDWAIPPLAGVDDPAAHPLLIRSAEGARVIFDGGRPLPRPKAVKKRPGVFSAPLPPVGGEPPKIWEPAARVRYLLAADLDAVQHFPASYLVIGSEVFLHPPDGTRPGKGAILASARELGIDVRRPHVTVRGLAFRNFTARSKWSAGVRASAAHVTIERCEAENASFGFLLVSDDGALVDSAARDVGGGVYLAGRRDRVERNRFVKQRDAFVVPTYLQDDTAIQAYSPSENATVRGNLAVGFAHGIFFKSRPSTWIAEGNTLVAGDGIEGGHYGFFAYDWDERSSFRGNVVTGYNAPAVFAWKEPGPEAERNCYSVPEPVPGKSVDPPSPPVADPRFVDPDDGDFRLAPDSPCLAGLEEKAIGADLRLERFSRTRAARDAAGAAMMARATTAARPAEASGAAGSGPNAGEPRDWHVAPSGRAGADGAAGSPMSSIQAAVDRAGPGDTIVLHPGLYPDPVRFVRGGREGRPITLRAAERGKAVLDGARRHDEMIRIENAPFVVIRDLEIRWYREIGVRVIRSPDARVEGCRIWNAHWGGNWPTGNGVQVEQSPRFAAVRNVLYRQERGIALRSSPAATITGNTAVSNLYAAVVFDRSIEGTTCTNNSFAYQGNDAISVVEGEGGNERLRTLTLDYNNYGLTLVPGPEGDRLQRLVPRDKDRPLQTESKAIVYWEEKGRTFQRFRSMEAWRAFSSVDAHSIFADPLFVGAAAGDFRVEPNSPNRGAGADGADIGALTD